METTNISTGKASSMKGKHSRNCLAVMTQGEARTIQREATTIQGEARTIQREATTIRHERTALFMEIIRISIFLNY